MDVEKLHITPEMVNAFQKKYREFWKGSWPDSETSRELIAAAMAASDAGSEAFRAALQSPPPVESVQEPVAWRWSAPPHGRFIYCEDKQEVLSADAQPLYATPVASPLREGDGYTKRVCPMRDAICPWGMGCPYVDGYSCKDGWRKRPASPDSTKATGGEDAASQ